MNVRQLQPVQLGEVGQVAAQGVGLGRAAQRGDLGGEGVGVGVHVEVRPVGELRPVRRLQRQQGQPLLELLADGGEGVGDDLGRGEHRGAGVEGVAVPLHPPGAAARAGSALDDGDLAAGAAQPQRGGQPGEAGARRRRPGRSARERCARSGGAGGGCDGEGVEGGAGVVGDRGGGDGGAGEGGALGDALLDAGAGAGVLEEPAERRRTRSAPAVGVAEAPRAAAGGRPRRPPARRARSAASACPRGGRRRRTCR